MEELRQRLRLIANGAVLIYEAEGLEIASLLRAQGRMDLFEVLDAITTALYWMQTELAQHIPEG